MKNKGGRPTKYKKEYCAKVYDYLATTDKANMELPMIEGFARYLNVARRTLYEWRDKYPEFLHTLDEIMTYQKMQLVNDGIYGGKEVNATIVKLLLQNNHDMRERQDVKTEVKIDYNTLTDDQLDKVIEQKEKEAGVH